MNPCQSIEKTGIEFRKIKSQRKFDFNYTRTVPHSYYKLAVPDRVAELQVYSKPD